MKKKLFLLSLVFYSLLSSAFEGNVEIDGINYHIITKGAVAEVVFKSSGYKGDIVIPPSVEYEGVTCSVTGIGNSAFYYENGLTSIVIPATVTKIGTGAFRACSKLKSVNIPASVETIGAQAFYECEGLETVKADNIESWCKMEIGQDANPLPYAQSFIIGDEEVENLVIPATITSICSRAFHGYKGLKTISFSESVTKIGDYAFFGCTGLQSVVFPYSISDVGVCAFYECTSLSSLTLSSGLTKIKERCFYGCNSLTKLNIPNTITEIETDAFKNCSSIKQIYLGSGLKTIGHTVFQNCSELTDVFCLAVEVPVISGYYKDYSLPFYNCHTEYATLHVPEGSISSYQTNDVWKGFGSIVALTPEDTGVRLVNTTTPVIVARYTLGGNLCKSTSSGISIARMSDGTTKKVINR